MFNFITDVFKNTAERFADKRAVADQNEALTFSQLYELASKISAAFDSDSGYIGVMAHRDIYTVAMFFGVAMAGKCYVPIDPEMPTEKLSKIIKSSGIDCVLSFKADDREKIGDAGAELLLLTSGMSAPLKSERENSEFLYTVYTSGSTGVPKGVLKTHSAMKSFTDAYIKEFGFDQNTVIGNQTPFYFDASAKDIYLMAACGATIEILPTSLFSFPVRLIEYMNDRRVSFISWVPSALSIVTALNTFTEIKPLYLKRVFFVGEAFSPKHLNKWMDALPDTEFVNLYGSSEICGISCFYRIPEKIEADKQIPIGAPLSNCEIRLVDDGRLVTEAGVPGEIYVSSPALAVGYIADADKTSKSFVLRDFGDGEKRYYRTGDIAKTDEHGRLVFLSRSDYQIKHMGHRIELGEIETAALAVKGIEKCCCLYHTAKNRIILYVQPSENTQLDAAFIRGELRARLSEYMLPHRVKITEKLPLNQNGKIDRAALAKELK